MTRRPNKNSAPRAGSPKKRTSTGIDAATIREAMGPGLAVPVAVERVVKTIERR